MTPIQIYALILAPFYLGGALSLLRLKVEGIPLGAALMTFSAFLITLIFLAGQSSTAAFAGLFLIIILFFFTLFFLVGLGLFIGGLIAWRRKRDYIYVLLILTAFSVPASLLAFGMYELESYRKAEELAEASAREEFLQKIFTASFGGYSVAFPISPITRIEHLCKNHSRVCFSSFRGTGLNMAEADSLVLLSIRFSSSPSVAGELVEWCAKRPDLAETTWCEPQYENEFTLHVEGRNRIPWGEGDGQRLYEAPEQVKALVCSEHWMGLDCRAIIDIAPGVEAHIPSRGLTPMAAGQRAVKSIPTIERYFETMLQTGDLQ